MDLSVLFEDNDILVLNKPAELHSVGGAGPSLAAWVAAHYPELANVGREGDSGLVQRLDFETSGVIIVARSQAVWDEYRALFAGGRIKKSYRVLIESALHEARFIAGYLGGRYRGSKKVSFSAAPRLRFEEASIEVVPLHSWREGTVLEVRCGGATRHQVRALLASQGMPLWGDKLYGGTREAAWHGPPFLLHAERVVVQHAHSERAFIAPLPEYFTYMEQS